MRCGPLTIAKMLFYTLQIAKMLYGPLAVPWPSRRDMVVRLYQVGGTSRIDNIHRIGIALFLECLYIQGCIRALFDGLVLSASLSSSLWLLPRLRVRKSHTSALSPSSLTVRQQAVNEQLHRF
ncbi:unnamed protein product [Vitrella brassicaformis CCMP3155]|uniref:Uncharacterized protein n=1 Tax=Vitrella brassicaformis (strain CCMP3155) TaxID=1169540 RepID=A0A0G4H2Y6_VITBC|nr:unnamed protein product [Vitrella brassicaformis CCMP3155]|eukprot:CEM38059.1 unnamed protein product [Vitrella brassicaformis CCMP3155]